MPVTSDTAWGPEQGIEPVYDCPDCSFTRMGVTTSRHGFKLHLLKEHGYTMEEVARLLPGAR